MGTFILFHSDSITDGNRCKEESQAGDLNHQMEHSCAYIINGMWGCRYPAKRLRFANRGVSGFRIADLCSRLQEDIINLKPDILSLLIAGLCTDALKPPTTKEEYISLVSTMPAV